jgi:hypothetical protein
MRLQITSVLFSKVLEQLGKLDLGRLTLSHNVETFLMALNVNSPTPLERNVSTSSSNVMDASLRLER